MKKFLQVLLTIVFAAVFSLSLIACGDREQEREQDGEPDIFWKEIVIGIDENNVASWEPLEGVTGYHIAYVRDDAGCPTEIAEKDIEETSVQLYPGCSVHVAAILPDGSYGSIWTSEYVAGEFDLKTLDILLGDTINKADVTEDFDLDYASLMSWDPIESIDINSVKHEEDGSVTFEAMGPDGSPVRFFGYDIDVNENSLVFHKEGRMISMDSIGRVVSIDPVLGDTGSESNVMDVFGGFDTYKDPHPTDLSHMIYTTGFARYSFSYTKEHYSHCYDFLRIQPNFIGFGIVPLSYETEGYINEDDCTLEELNVLYMPDAECTGFKAVVLDDERYGFALEGEKYDKSKEGRYSPYSKIFDFTLYAVPDIVGEKAPKTIEELKRTDAADYAAFLSDAPGSYTIGDLKDSNGNVLDKDNAKYEKGMTLTVNLGSDAFNVAYSVTSLIGNLKTMHDLVPYAFPEATGDLNVLVVPIAWQDEKGNATDKAYDDLENEFGRLIDRNGKITDHSGKLENRFSLSEYFDIASYGKMRVNSFMTDWYMAPYDFSEYRHMDVDVNFENEVLDWFYEKYPDVDMSMFDKDSNGYIDAAVFVNIGDMSSADGFTIISFEGAILRRETYGKEYAGTPERPKINCVVNMNSMHFADNTLIHEFSHGLGLIDYYDVTYSGGDAVGGYDMQSGSVGDWNVYSKCSVGWVEPVVVRNLSAGEMQEITIRSFADTGDAIVIPAVGSGEKVPFGEYIALELFTGTGVDKYDASKYGLDGFEGVRIYHVDANMESHDYVPNDKPDMEPVTVGTIHYANDYKENGRYNLEVIQAGGVNTFTDLTKEIRNLNKSDFFKAGDSFTLGKYSEFFDDGKFDFCDDFGYRIDIVSITGKGENTEAVIRVTRE